MISKKKKLLQISLKKETFDILEKMAKANKKTKSEIIETAMLVMITTIISAREKNQKEKN